MFMNEINRNRHDIGKDKARETMAIPFNNDEPCGRQHLHGFLGILQVEDEVDIDEFAKVMDACKEYNDRGTYGGDTTEEEPRHRRRYPARR